MISDNIFIAKLDDAVRIGSKRPAFIGFLNESELAQAKMYLKNKYDGLVFWGGYEDAMRKIIGFFPEYIEPEYNQIPLKAISFEFSKSHSLSHRDFLGAFMALGIERSAIGDILIENGRCVVFVKEELCSYLYSNIEKIGRVGVKTFLGYNGDLPVCNDFEENTGVVASSRLDCIVALFSHKSRDKAANLVQSGDVSVNHIEIIAPAKAVKDGDIISIRRHGRFTIDKLGPLTAKGRTKIQYRRWK